MASPQRKNETIIRTEVNTVHTPDVVKIENRSRVKKTCMVLGVAFLVIGVLGFFLPGFLGTHLSPAHNWVHLISGAASLWFARDKCPQEATIGFALIFGIAYGLLGLVGFVAGSPQVSAVGTLQHDPFLLPIAPGSFELGLHDHILHVAIGALFVWAALSGKRSPAVKIN